jgi:hypothetical protein
VNYKRNQNREFVEEQLQAVPAKPSIFPQLPYETDGFAVYYYSENQIFEIQIKQAPYEQNVENAMIFLNRYEETKDYSQDDVRIVAPSVMYFTGEIEEE